ncbi:MAG: rhombotarget lipoprotein [Pseudomonadota bacterium]
MKLLKWSILMLACLLTLAGCSSLRGGDKRSQAGSVVDYLFPSAKESPNLQPSVTYLRPPVRVGVAFVPGGGYDSLPEPEKLKLIERVKAQFSQHRFIGAIEVIPTSYLRPKGGFANLDQVARMYNVEVMALLSYDQVQFNDSNRLSLLYWTLIGAYVIKGDQYDIQTMVDASVFDVKSRTLLFRAPGTSQIKGSASLVGFSAQARSARSEGYVQAIDQLIPQLQTELSTFRERVKNDASIRVENKAGYSGGGSFDAVFLALAALLAALAWRQPWQKPTERQGAFS